MWAKRPNNTLYTLPMQYGVNLRIAATWQNGTLAYGSAPAAFTPRYYPPALEAIKPLTKEEEGRVMYFQRDPGGAFLSHHSNHRKEPPPTPEERRERQARREERLAAFDRVRAKRCPCPACPR